MGAVVNVKPNLKQLSESTTSNDNIRKIVAKKNEALAWVDEVKIMTAYDKRI